ncbi:MAG: cytochrome P450 [Sphingomonadaceae bacterium]|uniref:cytochrome P450 n=1 Tax=Thermaurantiacus sp. TaxID=2820283 RepID=UPI00298EED14|nr:cytochrome P450 [Thermaurantiacus sp.]MCS6986220.1 cytochrome P450 [Sphingomonadaceae bacterium]MDW8415877.1 cytochrome P450 [Thermaurantiacus sp.]
MATHAVEEKFPGWSTDRIDDRLVNPYLYAEPAQLFADYAELRRRPGLYWATPVGYRPFWAVTRHADVTQVSKANDRFVNRFRTYLSPIEGEQWTLKVAGDTHLFRTLVDLDDPEHRKLRQITHAWFQPGAIRQNLEGKVRAIAREHVELMRAKGDVLDFVNEVALWYPLRVIMMILGVPREDEPLMLKLTQELFGAIDPDVVARSRRITDSAGFWARSGNAQVDLFQVAQVFFEYFGKMLADRRAHPKDDVATVIAQGTIDGAPIPEREALSYYVIIATAGHDTTSSSTAGGFCELARNPAEFRKVRDNPALIPAFVEESIRWTTPVKHFMRTCVADTEVAGTLVRAGEALALFYWSANRDETVFDDPMTFRADRDPNPHIAFGHGVHICLGMHLARFEMRILWEELLPKLESVELAGEPKLSIANFVSGLKTLPVRVKWR